MKRRNFLVSSIVAGGFVSGSVHAQVEAWPTRPIRVIVPFPPGTANDIAARVLAQSFGPQLSQPIVVENLTGAGGTIAFNAAAQAKNGHTLLLASTSMTIAPYASAVRYDVVRDFDAIGQSDEQPDWLAYSSVDSRCSPSKLCDLLFGISDLCENTCGVLTQRWRRKRNLSLRPGHLHGNRRRDDGALSGVHVCFKETRSRKVGVVLERFDAIDHAARNADCLESGYRVGRA